MTLDLSNTADVDPEGWLNRLEKEIPDWLDRFLADPGRVNAFRAGEVVHAAKVLILRMQEAMESARETIEGEAT